MAYNPLSQPLTKWGAILQVVPQLVKGNGLFCFVSQYIWLCERIVRHHAPFEQALFLRSQGNVRIDAHDFGVLGKTRSWKQLEPGIQIWATNYHTWAVPNGMLFWNSSWKILDDSMFGLIF